MGLLQLSWGHVAVVLVDLLVVVPVGPFRGGELDRIDTGPWRLGFDRFGFLYSPLVLGATLATGRRIPGSLSLYSCLLGEAFQLRDDLIGAFGDTQRTGKPSGLDQEQGKLNLLTISGGSGSSVCDSGMDDPSDEARMSGEMRVDHLVAAAVRALSSGELAVQWQEEFARLARDITVRDH